MFLRHDLAWWGFVLAVAAIILAIPMDIVAHLLAPRIKNWWAERSESSTRNRITALEKRLSEYEANYKQLSEAEDWMLKGIEAIGMIVATALTDLACILSLTGDQKSIFNHLQEFMVPHPTNISIAFIAFATLFIVVAPILAVFRPLGDFRKKRSPEVRKNLGKSIDELKRKLVMRQQSR